MVSIPMFDFVNDHTLLLKQLNTIQTDPHTNISAWGFAPESTWLWIGIGAAILISIALIVSIASYFIIYDYKVSLYKKREVYEDETKTFEERHRVFRESREEEYNYSIWRTKINPFYDVQRDSTMAWECCDDNVYSQMIHKVLFEDHKINWGPAIVQYGYGLFLNISSQFLLTFYLFFTSVLPRFLDLENSQSPTFCQISSLLKFTALLIFLFSMLSKVVYFYKGACIIFSSTYRIENEDGTRTVWTMSEYKPCHRALLFVICWLTEFLQWCFLILCGMGYLLFADSIETLIMNALSLEFILEIDEMIFRVLTPANCESSQYQIGLTNYPPKRSPSNKYNIFQYMGMYFTTFCTRFLPLILSIMSIVLLDDYVGCSYCPNGNSCPVNLQLPENESLLIALNTSHKLAANQTQINPRRVLTSFDILWPFIVVTFFIINEMGRFVTVIENTIYYKQTPIHTKERQDLSGTVLPPEPMSKEEFKYRMRMFVDLPRSKSNKFKRFKHCAIL